MDNSFEINSKFQVLLIIDLKQILNFKCNW